MITQEQAAALNVGDEVVATFTGVHDTQHTVRGKVHASASSGALYVGGILLRAYDGNPDPDRDLSLAVISRKLPPLYANHPRPAPAMGDVVRKTGPQAAYAENLTWFFDGLDWRSTDGARAITGGMPRGVTLLVDGTTGRIVP